MAMDTTEINLIDPVDGRSDEAHNLTPYLCLSLGRRLDYASWPERKRFIELDCAIAAEIKIKCQYAELWGRPATGSDNELFTPRGSPIPTDGDHLNLKSGQRIH
jgi:hypothetical protein